MSSPTGHGRIPRRERALPVPKPLGRLLVTAGAFVLGVALASVTLVFQWREGSGTTSSATASKIATSHYALLAMTPEQLGKVDLALMNLLCAKGLPGAEELDIPAVLAKLDEWAKTVKFHTERHLYRVTDPRYAEHYNHSEARLRAEFIVQVLQEDCGVHYNEERIFNVDFSNPADLFIHGMVSNDNGGTCASMPVLYTAIGRRLGYPMKLVLAKQHIFCRWDEGKEVFNIDGATNGGVNYHPDEHYRSWPMPISDAEMATGEFLKSLTPEEELSTFLLSRGTCLHANKRLADARACLAETHRLMPKAITPMLALRSAMAGNGQRRLPIPPQQPHYQTIDPNDPTAQIYQQIMGPPGGVYGQPIQSGVPGQPQQPGFAGQHQTGYPTPAGRRH